MTWNCIEAPPPLTELRSRNPSQTLSMTLGFRLCKLDCVVLLTSTHLRGDRLSGVRCLSMVQVSNLGVYILGDHAGACCGIFGAAIGLRRRQLQCWWFWKMCTHLVACFVCCRCATCRRLTRTGDADACRDPRPQNESALALLAGERLEGYLLGASPRK